MTAVVVTYRRPDQLDRTLRSLADQTYADWTALVCDDSSGDETCDVIAGWARRDPRFIPMPAERNLGMPGNLNRGLRAAATGRDVVVVHDGDIYHQGAFGAFRAALDRWPRAGIVFNRYEAHDADGAGLPTRSERFAEYTPGPEFLQRHFHGRWTFGSPIHGTAAIRYEALDDVGLPDRRFAHLADVDLWMRICERWGVAFVDEPLISLAARTSSAERWDTSQREERRLTRRIYLESRLRRHAEAPVGRALSLAQHALFATMHEVYYTGAEVRRKVRRAS